ncbi:MAG: T9SS type A sorting domain-containing protein [Chitinophagaceae bacterium]|nr:MAG: T9SS type A sorting domain-containing protein [Chitinophagaceae bacterium]
MPPAPMVSCHFLLKYGLSVMKACLPLLILLFIFIHVNAQWSNTSNIFTNEQHMPVCTAAGDQTQAVVVSSLPDGGYFVLWEDKRAGFSEPFSIYAQKYSAAGNRMWAVDGIKISSGTNNQQFTFSSGQDYRNRKVAASDNAGGLYLTYGDDSLTNGSGKRICVQHVRPDGTLVFPGAGRIVAQTPSGQVSSFKWPQMISDNQGGFYVSYVNSNVSFDDFVHVYNYKDEGGVLKLYGGGVVNYNPVSELVSNPCGGPKIDLLNPTITVIDYNIWPDLQGNCSVVMSLYGNKGTQGNMLGYNKVWKAKQDHVSTITQFLADMSSDTFNITYKAGDAAVLYTHRIDPINARCSAPNNTFYVWIDYHVRSSGYRLLDKSDLPYYAVKGATMGTPGNINAELITCSRRSIVAGSTTEPVVFAIGFGDEIYTSVPYQRESNANPLLGYNTTPPAGMDQLDYFSDTLMGSGVTAYDYSLAAGGTQAYLTALVQEKITDNALHVLLQHMDIAAKPGAGYFINYQTGVKRGVMIGSELNTGFGGTAIDYDFPLVTANSTGNALFSINELGRYTRVSPVFTKAELAWGAMGTPLGSPMQDGSFLSVMNPFIGMHASNGTAVAGWNDRRAPAGTQDVYIRHLDNLNVSSYAPPGNKVIPLPTGSLVANPFVLSGVSKKYSMIEAFSPGTGMLTPVVGILDNINLGSVPVGVFENTGGIRVAGGKPYLDRNFTITPQIGPAGSPVSVRLYFTAAQFETLKMADPGITDPGSLAVLKQSNATGLVPSSYVSGGSETELRPVDWKSVDGGYYVEIVVDGFSNFFIQKASATLPVTWLGVQAERQDARQAWVSWQVGDEVNVKNYVVQQSTNGVDFTDQCVVVAGGLPSYRCLVPAPATSLNYYRVKQTDVDGRFTYSKTVTLEAWADESVILYPNPAHDLLYVRNANRYQLLRITDLRGRVLLQQSTALSAEVDIRKLVPGVYIVQLTGDKGNCSVMFLKE